VYKDEGISGAKSREQRPGFDRVLTDASHGKYDVLMAWAIDRLSRSTMDLLKTSQHIQACGVSLFIKDDPIDTTTPEGELFFTIMGAVATFERKLIKKRIQLKLDAKKDEIRRNGKFVTKAGIVRSKLGRPGAQPEKLAQARELLNQGLGIRKIAAQLGLGNGTVAQIKNGMVAA
jgi:DNA invertase Pin-like site-specific DNA recombinase